MIRLFLTLAIAVAATPALAQERPSTASASGTMSVVQRGLSAAAAPAGRFDRPQAAGGLKVDRSRIIDGAAVFRVGGDADRVYRIRLADGAASREVAIWSYNVGDVTHSRLARLDFSGYDTLRISSDTPLIFVDAAGRPTALPLSIDYE